VSQVKKAHLEGEAPVNGMAHLLQAGVGGELNHGRRSTHEDECVITGWRKVVLHHILTDEALAVFPAYHMKLNISTRHPLVKY